MTVQPENERNKAVVDEYFKVGVQGHLVILVVIVLAAATASLAGGAANPTTI